MSAWRRYDSPLLPAFNERFEQRWGKGTAPFLDPELQAQPVPRAQWINADTGAAVAVVPVWTDDETNRSFATFYLPPTGDIWLLRPGITDYLESQQTKHITLRNQAFKKSSRLRQSIHLRTRRQQHLNTRNQPPQHQHR